MIRALVHGRNDTTLQIISELQWRYDYLMMLLVMVFLSVVMAPWFRRRGWM